MTAQQEEQYAEQPQTARPQPRTAQNKLKPSPQENISNFRELIGQAVSELAKHPNAPSVAWSGKARQAMPSSFAEISLRVPTFEAMYTGQTNRMAINLEIDSEAKKCDLLQLIVQLAARSIQAPIYSLQYVKKGSVTIQTIIDFGPAPAAAYQMATDLNRYLPNLCYLVSPSAFAVGGDPQTTICFNDFLVDNVIEEMISDKQRELGLGSRAEAAMHVALSGIPASASSLRPASGGASAIVDDGSGTDVGITADDVLKFVIAPTRLAAQWAGQTSGPPAAAAMMAMAVMTKVIAHPTDDGVFYATVPRPDMVWNWFWTYPILAQRLQAQLLTRFGILFTVAMCDAVFTGGVSTGPTGGSAVAVKDANDEGADPDDDDPLSAIYRADIRKQQEASDRPAVPYLPPAYAAPVPTTAPPQPYVAPAATTGSAFEAMFQPSAIAAAEAAAANATPSGSFLQNVSSATSALSSAVVPSSSFLPSVAEDDDDLYPAADKIEPLATKSPTLKAMGDQKRTGFETIQAISTTTIGGAGGSSNGFRIFVPVLPTPAVAFKRVREDDVSGNGVMSNPLPVISGAGVLGSASGVAAGGGGLLPAPPILSAPPLPFGGLVSIPPAVAPHSPSSLRTDKEIAKLAADFVLTKDTHYSAKIDQSFNYYTSYVSTERDVLRASSAFVKMRWWLDFASSAETYKPATRASVTDMHKLQSNLIGMSLTQAADVIAQTKARRARSAYPTPLWWKLTVDAASSSSATEGVAPYPTYGNPFPSTIPDWKATLADPKVSEHLSSSNGMYYYRFTPVGTTKEKSSYKHPATKREYVFTPQAFLFDTVSKAQDGKVGDTPLSCFMGRIVPTIKSAVGAGKQPNEIAQQIVEKHYPDMCRLLMCFLRYYFLKQWFIDHPHPTVHERPTYTKSGEWVVEMVEQATGQRASESPHPTLVDLALWLSDQNYRVEYMDELVEMLMDIKYPTTLRV